MSEKESTLAEQYERERKILEQTLANALIDFTARTGFVVNSVLPIYHDFRTQSSIRFVAKPAGAGGDTNGLELPYYNVAIKVQI